MRMLFAAVLAAFALTGPAAAQRAHSGFDRVNAADGLRVEITIARAYSVVVTGEDADRVATRVRDETLQIRERNRGWFGVTRDLDAVVRVSMPAISGIAASRGAMVSADNISADDMSLSAAMGGEIRVSGTCDTLDASAAMGGVIEAGNLRCRNADVSAAMGGDISAHAENALDASAAMGGSIDIAGSPRTRDASSFMGGSIHIVR